MAGGTSLVVPIVLWGKTPLTHCISCVYLSPDQRTLVTGCYDGQICLWAVSPETLKMTPRCLLVGHTAPVLCLAHASIIADNAFFVSSSENGEMSTWDIVDGKCREVTKSIYIHTNIQAYRMVGTEDVRLFCNGYYAEVIIMNPFTLEIIFSLSSRVNPDWISALYVLKPHTCKDDVVLGLTTTGTVKVWTLEPRDYGPTDVSVFENESKQIRCLNALTMACCSQHQRTVLIVCSKCWQIYDAGDFSALCTVYAPRGERWLGGEFLAPDRVLIWTDDGKGYLYKLPANSIVENKNFHKQAEDGDIPYLYSLLSVTSNHLYCSPAIRFYESLQHGKILIRGDSEGAVNIWKIPELSPAQLSVIKENDSHKKLIGLSPFMCTSLSKAWESMKPNPVGILNQLDCENVPNIKLTASIYLAGQSRLVIGRQDGSIVIIPATQTVMLQLLHGNHQHYKDWPPHQILLGHNGRVNCLLYPHHMHPRYDKSHLLSGGVDFAICLWDLYAGTLLHRFCVHAGEITQLLVPPNTCANPRILKCICSVASDHSVTLLSLSERKCVVLASRHLFPVVTIKWRPLDDFMIVGCSDATVYVWQMETGHLDRVLHGISGEQVLYACDENTTISSSVDSGLANPAVHFFRGLRHRNISAIKHATQRGIHQLQQLHHSAHSDGTDHSKTRAYPLMVQGLRTNPNDPECHILCFDIEALVVQLLSEEYGLMSPKTMEAQGLINATEFQKITALTQSVSSDAHKKIADFFGKVKDKADNMERILKEKDKHGILPKRKDGSETILTKLQSVIDGFDSKSNDKGLNLSGVVCRKVCGANLTMEIAQLLMSLLYAWGLDFEIDKICETKLGLLRPMIPVSFGVISKGGFMSLLLPTWQSSIDLEDNYVKSSNGPLMDLPPEMVRLELLTRLFTARTHWEVSTTVTSQHLLAIVAIANTLISMSAPCFLENTFSRQQSVKSRLEEGNGEQSTSQVAFIKQGWAQLKTLHCKSLPEKVVNHGSKSYKRIQIEMLAHRWQHHCLEVRTAAQELLLAELERIGPKGRKTLVEFWVQYLPVSNTNGSMKPTAVSSNNLTNLNINENVESSANIQDDDDDDEEEDLCLRKPSSVSELRRKQMTAVILMGVIGAEFGQEVNASDNVSTSSRSQSGISIRRKSSIVEGFGIGNNNLSRLTSLALTQLLLTPSSTKLPAHMALRRAAVDLIGRGFAVWEPYFDVSKVLLGILELCCDNDKLVPSMSYGLPLTPSADSYRTARHALISIANVRPAVFITTIAREVARYNSMQQNTQAMNMAISNSVLHRAKPEILSIVEHLIEKMHVEMTDLLVEVMDIILHCVDPTQLKTRPLSEISPAISRFSQVTHCSTSRRIAVGTKNGSIALYELRSSKCQTINAHTAAICACAFSPDGKFLVSYSAAENKLSFWQTSTGMFGLGNSQTKCTKSYSTQKKDSTRASQLRQIKLHWASNRSVRFFSDGLETTFVI
ncbi:WD repeat-containing protein 7 isoform X2 [Rhopalosiphum padi]|uniref:WD repeat-containing protein 7 isoform X2 n=1 Tax=Rhopalosiphum padi TaxID=40932 RepID=UPI00298E5465|nr:WD repeat-containing protein 7 isoform X2 [Rhopalosiphum padi]